MSQNPVRLDRRRGAAPRARRPGAYAAAAPGRLRPAGPGEQRLSGPDPAPRGDRGRGRRRPPLGRGLHRLPAGHGQHGAARRTGARTRRILRLRGRARPLLRLRGQPRGPHRADRARLAARLRRGQPRLDRGRLPALRAPRPPSCRTPIPKPYARRSTPTPGAGARGQRRGVLGGRRRGPAAPNWPRPAGSTAPPCSSTTRTGSGVLGDGGRGAPNAAGLAGADDVVATVTLSKSLGSQGGAILGPARVVEHLVNAARTFIFDTGPRPGGRRRRAGAPATAAPRSPSGPGAPGGRPVRCTGCSRRRD